MVWGYGESKLRCVSGTLGHHSHYCASTNRPAARLRLRTWRLCRAALRRVTAITADTLCRLVRRLSPELSERDRARRPLACCSDSESSPYPTSDCRSPPFIPPRHVGQPRACVFVLEGCAFIGKTVLWVVMAFPGRALGITAATGLLLYLFGFPSRAAIGLCLVTFLVTGRAYTKLFIKTFPRDLWYLHSLFLNLNLLLVSSPGWPITWSTCSALPGGTRNTI